MAVFRATHNSYSGNIGGARGTIVEQLEAGVRFIEFDFHDSGFDGETQDYEVGHLFPGWDVDSDGSNPDTDVLKAWLEIIASWSDSHPGHLPITVLLDSKGNLVDNEGHKAGDPTFLNEEILSVFGEERVFAAEDLGGPGQGDGGPGPFGYGGSWPSVADLSGKVMFVLSGDAGSRMGYLRDVGYHPAVAMDEKGRVVEVHDNGLGDLWYWTGQLQMDGSIRWLRHGRYDTGTDPAVAINNEGWIVEVHKSEIAPTLWYAVGNLGDDYGIAWGEAEQYDTGVSPTIRFESLSGMSLHEIHQSEFTGMHWDWKATLDPGGSTDPAACAVTWGEHGTTDLPLYTEAEGTSIAGTVSVSSGEEGIFSQVLKYATSAGGKGRIRFRQVLFVESQKSDFTDLGPEEPAFHASKASTSAGTKAWLQEKMSEGRIVRLWQFDEEHVGLMPTYPATDYPYSDWYKEFCDSAVCE